MTDIPPRPTIDYANLPYLSREGIQAAGNYRFATASLFLETAPTKEAEDKALWCLSEHEIFANGKWYPSAWMVYIHATDEYDALRKICGNVRQWEAIKGMLYRGGRFEDTVLPHWQAEAAYLQKTRLRAQLEQAALALQPGYASAAKMLLTMIDGAPKKGRPKKEKEQPADSGIVDDEKRMLNFGT